MAAVAAGEVSRLMPDVADHFRENARRAAGAAQKAGGLPHVSRREPFVRPAIVSPEASRDACLAHDSVDEAWRRAENGLWDECIEKVGGALELAKAAAGNAGVDRPRFHGGPLTLMRLRHFRVDGTASGWAHVVGELRDGKADARAILDEFENPTFDGPEMEEWARRVRSDEDDGQIWHRSHGALVAYGRLLEMSESPDLSRMLVEIEGLGVTPILKRSDWGPCGSMVEHASL